MTGLMGLGTKERVGWVGSFYTLLKYFLSQHRWHDKARLGVAITFFAESKWIRFQVIFVALVQE